MPNVTKTWMLTANEDSGGCLMARVYGKDAALIQQADFGTITVYWRRGDVTSSISSSSLSPSTVVFDTLQTDARWTADDTGYNFRWDWDAVAFPDPGLYRVTVRFAPTSGAAYNGIQAEIRVPRTEAS